MKENSYPVDQSGKPNLSYYRDSAAYYAEMHAQALRDARNREIDAGQTFGRRVHANWGLIAKGAESVPFALMMLASSDRDAREDGAAVLAEVGRDDAVVDQLLTALAAETDSQARDSIVLALGSLRNRRAVPVLVGLIEDETVDGDTRWMAVEALGKIVRKRFLDQPDPMDAALEWISRERRLGKI